MSEIRESNRMNQCLKDQTQLEEGHDDTTDSDAQQDLSFRLRDVDPDGETIRDTSSDGMSFAGTVVRGGVGHSAASGNYQATSEELSFQ